MTATSGDAPSVAGTNRTLQTLSLVTVAAILLLVTLGGIVRVTESGLGCPDWPLCYGRLLPPLETPALIEYSHRLLASVTGLLVIATAVAAWRSHPSRRWLLYPAAIAVVLVVTQAIVGGITVETELASGLILLHLAMAEALLAALLLVAVVAFRGDPRPLRGSPVQTLFLGTAIATYALLLLGSLVTVLGASTACGTAWPLCAGQPLLPAAHAPAVHMLHRAASLVIGLLLLATFAAAWRRRRSQPELATAAGLTLGLLVAQILVGALFVLLGFPTAVQVLHLTMATAVWAAVAAMPMLLLTSQRLPASGVRHA